MVPSSPVGRLDRLFVPPDIGGPRVRLGVLWFLLALAAVTSGRWWTAIIAAVVAALAGYQSMRCWIVAAVREDDGDAVPPDAQRRCLLAAAGCAAAPLAAGWGTGLAGVVLLVLAGVGGAGILRPGDDTVVPRSMALATIPAAIAAASIVLAVRLDLWAGVFLIVAVSLYDAGSFLLGADAAGRWEGPAAGMIGALAVTFTFATVQVGPLSTGGWWAVGVVVAGSCLLGQWVAAASLPHPRAWAPALRRLDAYIVGGPALVASLWAFGV